MSRLLITLRNASTGALVVGETVTLWKEAGAGLQIGGAFNAVGDGTYYFDMAGVDSQVVTIKVGGVIQAEYKSIVAIGEDVVDHLLLDGFGGAAIASSVHGLVADDGEFMGTDKEQTVTDTTMTAACTIDAAAITAGILPAARIENVSITDAKIISITGANKVKGSSVQLEGSTPGLVDSTGLMVKIDSSNPSLELDADGINVLLNGTTPGITKTPTGLRFDPTNMLELTTGNTVNFTAIRTDWSDPHYFAESDNTGQAIARLDNALYRFRIDRDDGDSSAVAFYAQGHEVARNTADAEAAAVSVTTEYFLGDGTPRRKVCQSFMKTDYMDKVVIRCQFANTAASNTTILVQITNDAGSVQETYTQTENGTTFTTLDLVADLRELSSGFYWVVITLSAAAGVAHLRNVFMFTCNDSYLSGEANAAPYWGALEQPM